MTKDDIDRFVESVRGEIEVATSLYPTFHSTHEGYAVILEEVEELWQLVRGNKGLRGNPEMERECIQIAAMACRFALDLCQTTPDSLQESLPLPSFQE